jgi:putative ABC transport system permease protein
MRRPFLLVAYLAARDLLHERRLTICSCVGLAAVLVPLVMLWGLKNGIVEGLRADLIENPRARTVANLTNRRFDPAFLSQLANRPDVAFVAPRLRTLNNEARFERIDKPQSPRRAELLATGAGDPLLGRIAPPGPGEIVATASLAERLGLAEGSKVTMKVFRSQNRDVLALPLVVKGVAPVSSIGRDAVFADLRLLVLVDDFLEDKVPPTATPADVNLADRAFAGFRAHARKLEDVLSLESFFRGRDLDVETHAAEIAGLLKLDKSLTTLFTALASLGALGYFASLGVGLYANVERKQSELSLLRLIGLRRGALVRLPILQAAIIAVCGSLLGGLTALVGAAALNELPLPGTGTGNRPLCVVETWQLAVAIGSTTVGAVMAAAFAGRRAAHILPSEGIRNV